MRIGELAEAANCQTVTIRFYERKGLLGAAARSASNYRVYDEKDLERLLFIRNCRSLGLTLAETERLVDMHDHPVLDCSDVNACLENHLEQIHMQMEALKLLERDLRKLRSRCAVPGVSSGCGVLAALGSPSVNAA